MHADVKISLIKSLSRALNSSVSMIDWKLSKMKLIQAAYRKKEKKETTVRQEIINMTRLNKIKRRKIPSIGDRNKSGLIEAMALLSPESNDCQEESVHKRS